MIDHILISSFKEFLDWKMLKNSAADKKILSLLPITNDDRMSSFNILSAGERQFVYDSSLQGFQSPIIKSGSTVVVPTHIDYINSRVLMTKPNTISNGNIEVFCKRYNSYITTKSDEEIFAKMNPTDSKEVAPQQKIKADSYYHPCFFVKMFSTNNEGFALGGTDKTKFTFKVSFFVNNEYDHLFIQSVMRDLNGTAAYVLNNTPLNEFGDLKNPWNYETQSQLARANGNLKIHVENVFVNTLKSDNVLSKFPNSYIGVATFETWVIRNPRA